MTFTLSQKKKIAQLLLIVITAQLLSPMSAYALTSGPKQPETTGFRRADLTEMVDVQSGAFKYNIPLMDIDGYPINLDYHSGIGMDDEASWVGLGWSLTPGAINRQVRGLADDMAGDEMFVDQYMKPKVTIGGKVTAKVEVFGKRGAAGATFGVFNDNYTGLGAEVGFNAGISFALSNDGHLTAGLGVGVLSNTQTGVDVNMSPYVAMSVLVRKENNVTVNGAFSGSLGYNTRSGLKGFSTGLSFGTTASNAIKEEVFIPNVGSVNITGGGSGSTNFGITGSSVSYNTPAINPSIQIPFRSSYGSFSVDVGGAAWGVFGAVGGTGYRNVREVKEMHNSRQAYGFLYAERGKDKPAAVMDFIREKDNPVIPELPNLAIPIHTPDIWSFTSQAGSGQFRVYRGGSGAFFDNETRDESSITTLGADVGIGTYFHGGVTNFEQTGGTLTGKWKTANSYLAKGDFQPASTTDPGSEHAYFKVVGEPTMEDETFLTQAKGTDPVKVLVNKTGAQSTLINQNNIYQAVTPMVNTKRRPRQTVIGYLTASEADKGALDTKIPVYQANTPTVTTLGAKPVPTMISRTADYRKGDHISEISVTHPDGKRMVYGIPVYNIAQDEYTFAVGPQASGTNLAAIPFQLDNPKQNNKGIDNYYQREHTPAYATSFLLTGLLSPDYVDVTGDGISDDDLGTAISFHYSKTDFNYKWRAPFKDAALNRCLLADYEDDKGSVIYGEKELWYMSSIESKTKIAYFLTEERRDALGVSNVQASGGDYRDQTKRQRCLREIRLYAKSDMSRPIKVVKFEYTQELCRNVPNSMDLGTTDALKGGKLTLKRVWFEYGNSHKGQNFNYKFTYNKTVNGAEVNYGYMQADRWGAYKPASLNTNGLDNEAYPYTPQADRVSADKRAGLWNLSGIELPGGGRIAVTYEAGDYGYVQDKRAMVMTPVSGLVNANGDGTSLKDAKGIQIDIGNGESPPQAPSEVASWFKNRFLAGSDYMYVKLYVKLATVNANAQGREFDFVPVYCKVANVTVNGNIARIFFEDIQEAGRNPMAVAAWQRLRIEYPRFAYPGFENRIQEGNGSVSAAVSAIINAAKNLGELKGNFYDKAYGRNYANVVDLSKSFCKIVKTDGHKLGGEARVRQISINDNWGDMSGSTQPGISANYGQVYDYTVMENGRAISSGVATYEPGVGTDENVLKQPVPYVQDIKGSINNFFSLERPFVESLYPAPGVTYSRVKVRDLDMNGNATEKSGYTVSEFYTARDYPVHVDDLPLTREVGRVQSNYSPIGGNSIDELFLSQGYRIELNDMQGKLKAERSYNQSGAEIASTVYAYAESDDGRLDNHVDVIDTQGNRLQDKVIGREVELFTDFREQISINEGRALNLGVDVIPIIFGAPFPIPHFPVKENNDRKVFRSVCALKVVHTFGLLRNVTKTVNGASVTTENLAYDALTGATVITRTQNEFNQPIYQVKLPAYWVYEGMGGAYQNVGALLSNVKTDINGRIVENGSVPACLQVGDELVPVSGSGRYWVIETPITTISDIAIMSTSANAAFEKRLIDKDGFLGRNLNQQGSDNTMFKVVRSGYRNQLSQDAFSFSCLENPIVNNKLRITSADQQTSMKVLNASAITYNDKWAAKGSCDNCIANTALEFRYGEALPHDNHGMNGTIFLGSTDDRIIEGPVHSDYLDNRLNAVGIWLKNNPHNLNEWIGFETDIELNSSNGGFRVGFSGDDEFSYFIDDIPLAPPSQYVADAGSYWFVKTVYLNKGIHRLKVRAKNVPLSNTSIPDNNTTNPASIGIEIYSVCSIPTIKNGDSPIFSTRSLMNKDLINSFRSVNGQAISQYQCYTNPFTTGVYGNWRPYQNFVFQEKRNYTTEEQKGLDISKTGYISNFYSFWNLQSSSGTKSQWIQNMASSRWIEANRVMLYDIYGQQLENRDALGRYSSALYAFKGELPAAVAVNARYRELYADSFEDGAFRSTDTLSNCNKNEFVNAVNGASLISAMSGVTSHTGRKSLLLPASGISMNSAVHKSDWQTNNLLAFTLNGNYLTPNTPGLYPKGFEPVPAKPYLFSAWVKDSQPFTKNVNISLELNGNAVPELRCKAVVEGWKLIEGAFTIPNSTAAPVGLKLRGLAANIYVDDIRIHPADAQMKTYTYDPRNMRLMAEIDENGFATLYEYDDEGLLIRVKKETERGIMTVKESRSSLRKAL